MIRRFSIVRSVVIVVGIGLAAVQVANMRDGSPERDDDALFEILPLRPGERFRGDLVRLNGREPYSHTGDCSVVLVFDPGCPTCGMLADTIRERRNYALRDRLVWASTTSPERARDFARQHGLSTARIALIEGVAGDEAWDRLHALGITAVPTMVLISSSNGEVRHLQVQPSPPHPDTVARRCA